jgi:hypothetical protein
MQSVKVGLSMGGGKKRRLTATKDAGRNIAVR